ncbi:MAG TPA: hypothetical protein VGK58_25005 [Lacipirellulaceae bacterium]
MAKKKTPRRSTARRESIAVESIRHKDKRKNIPTEELRDFVTEEETRRRRYSIRAIHRSIRGLFGRAKMSKTGRI